MGVELAQFFPRSLQHDFDGSNYLSDSCLTAVPVVKLIYSALYRFYR